MAAYTSEDPTWLAWAKLVESTVRLFYGLPEVFIMKALLHGPRRVSKLTGNAHPEYQDDEAIAERIKLAHVYVRRLLMALEGDRLIKAYRPKAKEAPGEEKVAAAMQSAYTADSVQVLWGIDFEEHADAVMYKLDAMERRMSVQSESTLQAWRCPQCQLIISELEVDYNALLTPNGGLSCPSRSMACFGHEMVTVDDSASEAKAEAHKNALRMHTAQLQRCLNDVRELPPPLYIRPLPKPKDGSANAQGADGAGGSGSSGARGAGGAGGSSSSGGPAGSALGASKGIANAVGSGQGLLAPVPWMQSAGDVAASAAAAKAVASAGAAEASKQALSAAAAAESAQWEREYLQRYRESEQQAASGTIGGGGGGGPAAPSSTSLPLQSASAWTQAVQAEAGGGHGGDGAAAIGGGIAPMEEEEEEEEEEEGEEEMVTVAGEARPFSSVTEDHCSRMTDAEYTRYFELCQQAE